MQTLVSEDVLSQVGDYEHLATAQLHSCAHSLSQDKKSGFGVTGPTWIHDALAYTPSKDGVQVRQGCVGEASCQSPEPKHSLEDKKTVEVQSHYFPLKNKSFDC